MPSFSTPGDHRRARLYLQSINFEIIKAAALHRQAHGRGNGARAPAAMAARPVRVQVLSEGRKGENQQLVTPLGYRTAVRALPPILARLDASDPRRRAAEALATAAEKIGAIGNGGFDGGAPSGAVSDGGVTTRIKHATRLRLIEALTNGWTCDARGKIQRGPARVILQVQRQGRARQNIKAFDALALICVEGADLGTILRKYGWSVKTQHTRALGQGVLEILDDLAGALGFGRWHVKAGVDT